MKRLRDSIDRRRIAGVIVLAATLVSLLIAGRSSSLNPAPMPGGSPPTGATAFIKIEFGLKSKEPRQWQGSISVDSGEILNTVGWHFLPPDRVIDKNHWQLDTRLFVDRTIRYAGQDSLPPGFPILPNGVECEVKATPLASFRVQTNHGSFSFTLADLQAAGRLPFFDGDAAAVVTPAPRALTEGGATQHDFPAAAVLGDRLFVAWVAYHNDANTVYLAELQNGQWKVYRAAEAWGDYFGAAVAAHGGDRVVVSWSEYKNDRWRLISRAWNTALSRWETVRYVAENGRRQMFQRMATDAAGNAWIVWQEFRDGQSDIFLSRLAGTAWESPRQASESAADDWAPDIATAPDGTVYVAWDGYQAGHYDIFLRSFTGSTRSPVIRVTSGETYDANVSLAVDPSNRLWMAWEEGGPNWGKDWGMLGKPGSRTHESRQVRLVAYQGGAFREPAVPLMETVPGWLRSMHEYPQVAIGNNGLPYVFFRHYLHRIPTEDNQRTVRIGPESRVLAPWQETNRQMWDIFLTGFDGAKWLPVRQLPRSTGRCNMRLALARYPGGLWYIWPTDGRSYADPRVQTAQLQYAQMPTADQPAPRPAMKPYVSPPAQASSAAATEPADLARVREVRWRHDPPLRLFRGDLHRHTDISADGMQDGDILDAYRYALDAASLDFLAVTDHSGHERLNYFCYDWWRSRQMATLFNNPGRFITFFAYERTVTYPGGHRNIISTRRDFMPFRISDEEYTGVESYTERLFPYLHRQGDLAIPHTTAAGGGTSWQGKDSTVEPVVEIFQGFRGSYEAPEAPNRAPGSVNTDGLVWSAWARGWRLGVIASSDHLSTHQSYACVYAPELTPQAIHEAIRARCTFAATDNIIVKLEARTAGGRSWKMGEELETDGKPELHLEIEGTETCRESN